MEGERGSGGSLLCPRVLSRSRRVWGRWMPVELEDPPPHSTRCRLDLVHYILPPSEPLARKLSNFISLTESSIILSTKFGGSNFSQCPKIFTLSITFFIIKFVWVVVKGQSIIPPHPMETQVWQWSSAPTVDITGRKCQCKRS